MRPTDAGACQNCERPLSGPYCSNCGQKAVDLREAGLRTLLGEGLRGLFDRLYIVRDSLWLLTVPGHLTAQWLAGKRIGHLNPLRTWVLCTAVASFAMAATVPPVAEWAAQYAPDAAKKLGSAELEFLDGWRSVSKGALAALEAALVLLVSPAIYRFLLGPHERGLVAYVAAALHGSAAGSLLIAASVGLAWLLGGDLTDPGDWTVVLLGLAAVPVGAWYSWSVLRRGLGATPRLVLFAIAVEAVVILAIAAAAMLVDGGVAWFLIEALAESA